MKCPHCGVGFKAQANMHVLADDVDGVWRARWVKCPSCERLVVVLDRGTMKAGRAGPVFDAAETVVVRPQGASRPRCRPEVPADLADDYDEACLVIGESPKAAAALGRRCLQHLLRTSGQIRWGNLADEIQQVLDARILPPYLADSIDALQIICNFSMYPEKSTCAAAIVDVAPGEAEWILDVLEGLFDFSFVQPAVLQQKRAALDAKLGRRPPHEAAIEGGHDGGLAVRR